MLDETLTKLGLKFKHLIVLDVTFPDESLKEFASAYPSRYIHVPARGAIALEMAAGMASLGKLIAIIGSDLTECDLPDSTLNVKLLKRDENAVWDYLEEGLQSFGTGVLLIPEEE